MSNKLKGVGDYFSNLAKLNTTAQDVSEIKAFIEINRTITIALIKWMTDISEDVKGLKNIREKEEAFYEAMEYEVKKDIKVVKSKAKKAKNKKK